MDLNKLTAARIIALHNALLPSTPLAVSTGKQDAIAACAVAVIAPKQIAAAINDKPFNVRQALRAAHKTNGLAHQMKSRWALTVSDIVDLFPQLLPSVTKQDEAIAA